MDENRKKLMACAAIAVSEVKKAKAVELSECSIGEKDFLFTFLEARFSEGSFTLGRFLGNDGVNFVY